MANILQKWIYNLSAVAPLCLTLAFVWYTQQQDFVVPCICIGAFMLLVIVFLISFIYGKRHLPTTMINISNVSPHDAWIIAYLVSYVLPLASITIADYNLGLFAAVSFVIVLIIPFINSATPNPVLTFVGYHFYKISSEHGVDGYVLISRKKIRNPKEIKSVKRVFEFLLLDEEVNNV